MNLNSSAIKVFLTLVTLSVSTATMAEEISPYTATFDILRGNTSVGTANKVLSYPSEGQYLFTSDTKIKVALYRTEYTESSSGKVTDQGVQPSSYSMLTKGKTTFEKHDFADGIQDNLSQLLMLRHYLLQQETPKPTTLVSSEGQMTYTFSIVDPKAESDTALGKLVTTHVRFEDNKGNQVDEWLAEKYEYLPVIVQISKGGKTSSTIVIKTITPTK